MTGRLKDLSFGRNGEQIITLSVKADFTEQFDELKDFDVDIEIKKHRKMRSNEANKYCWVLCEKIAQQLSKENVRYTKLDIYRDAIREIGVWGEMQKLQTIIVSTKPFAPYASSNIHRSPL